MKKIDNKHNISLLRQLIKLCLVFQAKLGSPKPCLVVLDAKKSKQTAALDAVVYVVVVVLLIFQSFWVIFFRQIACSEIIVRENIT